MFKKVAIIGTGLIGGSIALAIKKNKLAKQVVGVSRHKKSLEEAKRIKAIDYGSLDVNIAKGADLIILAMPVEAILELSPEISKVTSKDTVVCDVGSTKEMIVKRLDKIFTNFVGTHPMAGSEKRGIINAKGSMFKNSLCIITPTKLTNKKSLQKVKALWQDIGAKTIILPSNEHDKSVSLVSHLPHILAFSLINAVPQKFLKFSSSGLKDTTRIALSDGEIWKDIFLSNRKNVLDSIKLIKKNLNQIECAIKTKNKKKLVSILNQAKKKRESLEKI